MSSHAGAGRLFIPVCDVRTPHDVRGSPSAGGEASPRGTRVAPSQQQQEWPKGEDRGVRENRVKGAGSPRARGAETET